MPKKVVNEWDHTKSRTCWLPFHKCITNTAMTQFKSSILMRQATMHFWAECVHPTSRCLAPWRQVNSCAFVRWKIKHYRTCSQLIGSGWCVFRSQVKRQNHNSLIFLLCSAALQNILVSPENIVVSKNVLYDNASEDETKRQLLKGWWAICLFKQSPVVLNNF